MEEETRQIVFETNGKTYKELYDDIIEENLRNPPPEGENTIKHHIRPRSISPDLIYSSENLVRLTEKVHLKVHYLLWQHYKRETDDRDSERKMCAAFWYMVHNIEWRGDVELEWISERFEELRVDFRKGISGENNPSKNPEVREKLSEARRNWLKNNPDNHPMKNPKSREKLSESMKETMNRPEVKVKISGDNNPMKNPKARAKLLETMNRPEVRAKMSEAKREWWKNNPEVGAKMIAKKCRKVLQYSLDGTFVAEYPSLHEAAEKTNSKVQSIWKCCRGEQKTHKGFVWKYAESK